MEECVLCGGRNGSRIETMSAQPLEKTFPVEKFRGTDFQLGVIDATLWGQRAFCAENLQTQTAFCNIFIGLNACIVVNKLQRLLAIYDAGHI